MKIKTRKITTQKKIKNCHVFSKNYESFTARNQFRKRREILPINSKFARLFFQFYLHIQGFSRFMQLSGHPETIISIIYVSIHELFTLNPLI